MSFINIRSKPLPAQCRLLAIALLMLFASCKKLIEIDAPKSEVVTATVYSDNATAIAAIRGIYSEMANSGAFASGGEQGVAVLCGLSADEYENYFFYSDFIDFYENTLSPLNTALAFGLWQEPYKYIYYSNSVLEGLEGSTGVTAALKKQLTGEAQFIRAFCHFYLVNLFGKVPVITTTDYRVNKTAPRSSEKDVYKLIIDDLKSAQENLSPDYSFSAGERLRPNSFAATAMLARTYLYTKQFDKAEIEASKVIARTADYALLPTLTNVFLKNSKEAIWQLAAGAQDIGTMEGSVLIPWDIPYSVTVSDDLLQTFEAGDKRLDSWIGIIEAGGDLYYYPYKYKIELGSGKPATEYSMVLRVAEQYLIRAEARAMQDKLPEAIEDLDTIRHRAGIPFIRTTDPSISKADLLFAIEKERRTELFSEWGHRWLDLKRTNRADVVLKPIKGSTWQKEDVLYPIPQKERENNPLLDQNDGYK